jgi:hypothetical protein
MKRIFGGESLIASENQGNAHDIRLNGGGQGRSGLHLQVSGAASQEKLEDLGGKTPRGVPAPPPELASVYVDVVARAYERSSLLVTTNLSFENWTEVLGSELLVAQIQSTSIVVGGRVVRAIPMVDGKGMITPVGSRVLESELGAVVARPLKLQKTFYVEWRDKVDVYRQKVGASPEECKMNRGDWLEKRADRLTVAEQQNEPEIIQLWTGFLPPVRDWFVDQDF